VTLNIPDGTTTEEAIEIARERAASTNRKVWITLSRIRVLYFNPDGTSYEGYGVPTSSLGGLPGRIAPDLASKAAEQLRRGVEKTPIEGETPP
jgi:hypothetical protein